MAPGVAVELKRVGYNVAFLGDSDRRLEPQRWNWLNREWRFFNGREMSRLKNASRLPILPLNDLQKLVDAAIGEFGAATVLNHISHFANVDLSAAGAELTAWINPEFPVEAVRAAIGKSASKGKIKEAKGGSRTSLWEPNWKNRRGNHSQHNRQPAC